MKFRKPTVREHAEQSVRARARAEVRVEVEAEEEVEQRVRARAGEAALANQPVAFPTSAGDHRPRSCEPRAAASAAKGVAPRALKPSLFRLRRKLLKPRAQAFRKRGLRKVYIYIYIYIYMGLGRDLRPERHRRAERKKFS